MDKPVNIRPGVSILSVLSHLNYKPWFALAEFVDNSIQSYLLNKERLIRINGPGYKLKVKIEINNLDGGQIIIRDNAAGISIKDFARAFKSAEIPPNSSGLSEFGMGMKSAACWFSSDWSVRTSALEEDFESNITFDVPKIVSERIEELEVKSRKIDPSRHFTEITLQKLHNIPQGRTKAKIKEHLTGIYREFTRKNELELYLDNELLSFEEVPILNAPHYDKLDSESITWKKEIQFDFGNDLQVKGFAAIREVASASKSGFALFRRGRLIQGSADEGFRPEIIFGNPNGFVYQRVFGELHLDGFEVSHTKDGFKWDENLDSFLEILKEELQKDPLPVLSQARQYRMKLNPERAKTAAETATERTANSIQKNLPPIIPRIQKDPLTGAPPSTLQKTNILSHKVIELEIENQKWKILLELSNDPSVGNWLELSDIPFPELEKIESGTRTLSLRVSLSHPFSERFGGADAFQIEPLLRIAASIGLAETLARDGGVKMAGTIRRNINEILKVLAD